jgi:hypothetical protein
VSRGCLSPVKSVTVTVDGVTYHGTYFVQDSIVHLRSPFGTKSSSVGRSPPETIAKLLPTELVRDSPNA